MKEYLTESEAAISRRITNITRLLPDDVSAYARYLELSCNKTINSVYDSIRRLNLFYEIISKTLGVAKNEVDSFFVINVGDCVINEYLYKSQQEKNSRLRLKPPTEREVITRRKRLEEYIYYLKIQQKERT